MKYNLKVAWRFERSLKVVPRTMKYSLTEKAHLESLEL